MRADTKPCGQPDCWCAMPFVTERGTVVHLPSVKGFELNEWFHVGGIVGPIVGVNRSHNCIHIANEAEQRRLYGRVFSRGVH